jgi:putative transposase
MAIVLRGRPTGTIVHNDRGGHFRSKKFAMMLRNNDLVGSMGRVASAGDNAAMESYFFLLLRKVLNRKAWVTREDLRLAIVTWIERTYHRRRRQRVLGKLTPIEFATIYNQTTVAA